MSVGVLAVLLSVAVGSAEQPTIEAGSDGAYGFAWRPSTAAIGIGGTVAFKNPSAVIPHGVTWKGGPEAPSCNGVPIDKEQTGWSGSCAFVQAGSYAFVCTTHPTEMKGTITVSEGETPTNPPPPTGEGSESLLAGKVSRALRLAGSQRGAAVRGSIALSKAGAAGRLRIELLAARAALLGRAVPSGAARVGRLVRARLKAGRVFFKVSLSRVARRALRQDERLAVTVRIVLNVPERKALKLKRRVVLRV